MSTCEIPLSLYQTLHSQAMARYLKHGFSLARARYSADLSMASAFRCEEWELQREQQQDYDDQTQGDWTR